MVTQYLTFFSTHWILTTLLIVTLIAIFTLELLNKVLSIKRLTPQETVQLINQQDGVIIDIRNPQTFDAGHIIHAINVVPTQLTQDLKTLLPDQNKPIIVVSEFDQTAATAARKILKQGYPSVHILAGGLRAWQSAGLPLEKNL
jgi:rhodanese-related sulfurtransferase